MTEAELTPKERQLARLLYAIERHDALSPPSAEVAPPLYCTLAARLLRNSATRNAAFNRMLMDDEVLAVTLKPEAKAGTDGGVVKLVRA